MLVSCSVGSTARARCCWASSLTARRRCRVEYGKPQSSPAETLEYWNWTEAIFVDKFSIFADNFPKRREEISQVKMFKPIYKHFLLHVFCRQFGHLGEIVCKYGFCPGLLGPAFWGFYRTALEALRTRTLWSESIDLNNIYEGLLLS